VADDNEATKEEEEKEEEQEEEEEEEEEEEDDIRTESRMSPMYIGPSWTPSVRAPTMNWSKM
jgi:hypothetical protein